MVDYVRGSGGYRLTAAELADLQAAFDKATDAFKVRPSETGLGKDIYSTILKDIQVVDFNFDPGQTIISRAPGVSPDVYAWIGGAIGVNGDSTFAGAFIRKYTVDQLLIREGSSLSQEAAVARAAKASNQIALSVAQDILSHDGDLPGISGLGAIDAGSAASGVFTITGHPADYAGWAGTLLFPYIGEPDFYKDWLLSDHEVSGTVPRIDGPGADSVVFKHYAGTYDLVAAIEAAGQAGLQALSEYAISGLGQGVFGPSGATQVDQSALISATNKFFGNYYSLASDSKFLPGDDLVFANLANKGFFNLGISNNYVVGPIDGSSQILTASTDRSNRTIIVGGQGDDIIRGTSRGDDLIDGGGGNNTIYAGSGKQIIFGGSYGTNVIYGNPDQQKSVTDILVGGPGGTNPGNQPGQTAPDASPASDPSKANYTITAGSGKSIMIGGKGVNTFNVKHYDSGSGAVEPAVNIIWGGGGASTYNFTGTAFISVFYMDDPSVGKITKLTQDELASISDTYLGDTIIINPGPEDKITLNGNPLSSASYQPQGRSDVYWVDFYNPNYGKTDDPRSHYFRYGSAGLNSYGPVGTIWPDGTEVLGYTHQGYYDFFGFADSNQGTQLLYRPGDTFVHSPNKIDVYDLGSSPGVSPSDSFHDFIEIGNFTLGGFGINLTGNGPVLVYHGDWSGSEEGSNAADAGFLAYNEKKYINVKMSEGDGTTIQSGPGKSILVSGGQNVDYVINAGAAQVTINNHNDKGIGGEGIVTLDSSFDSSDVTVNGKGDDLLISDVRAGLQVSILGSLTSPANRIAAVNFADGTTWTYSQLIAMATTGSPTNRDLYGDTDGNVLDSKGYAYYAAGGGGGDTFIYNTGYGDLYIDETDPNLSASNVLAFGDGIGPASVTVSGDTFGNLSLLLGNGDAVTLEQALANAGQVIHGVQRVTFADGTAWTYSDLLAASVTGTPTNTSIFGDAGANILDSKGYATYAQGNGGGDTFVFNAGYGQLEISGDSAATLRLGAGITAAALGVATDQSGNILLTDGITRDRIKIDAVLDVGGASYVPGIARAQFADGTILTRQQLLGMAVQGTLPVLVPAISGAVPGQAASDAAPILPFATVAITGQDTRLTETARITLTDAAGQATDANGLLTGAGLSRAGTGSYALSAASAAALTAALEQLSFTPTPHQVAPGLAVQTGFTLTVTNGQNASATSTAASVTTTAANTPPVISGAVVSQVTSDVAAVAPFASVSVVDPDIGAADSAVLVLSDGQGTATDANGVLSGAGLNKTGVGTYALAAASPGALAAALKAVQFIPTAHQVPAGQAVTTGLALAVTDDHGAAATTAKATVVATATSSLGTLVLHLSEDAWQGDAQFTVTVDGVQLGAAQAVTALHGLGEDEAFTFLGNFGTGPHEVGISFINDAWGGTPDTDRNLYVNSIALDGTAHPGATAALYSNGTLTFYAVGRPAAPLVPTTANPDVLVLRLSEDAWQGDAQFTVAVDGTQLGGTQGVWVSHALGQVQDFAFAGNFGTGPHDLAVTFLNDAWGGTASTDRNLYVGSADLNGTHYADAAGALYSNGTIHFRIGTPAG